MKRLFDIIIAGVGLIILSPLLAAIAVGVLIGMGKPVLFKQVRVGRHGVPFKLLKFRTMIKDADKQGPALTSGGDPRVTRFGRFLRRTKFDELPQLWNVVTGEMSLVGPRPEVPQYVKLYDDRQRQVLQVRPGITDPASIVYRDEEQILAKYPDAESAYVEKIMPAKLKLNLAYIDKAGVFSDLGLIIRTLGKIVRSR